MDFLGNFVYYFIDNGIEIIEIVIVFITFFGMRADLTRKNILLSFVTLVLFSFLWGLKTKNPVYLLLYFSFFMLEIRILYNEFTYKELLLKEIWAIIFINIVDGMVYNAITSVLGYFNISTIILVKVLTYIVVMVFLVVISKFIQEKVQFVHKITTSFYIIYLFVGFADFLILTCVFIITEDMDKRALIVSMIVSVSILLQYGLILLVTIANEELKFQHYLNQKYLILQKENYEYLEYREEETKKFRHDYRNHLNSLQILCKEKRYEDVENYLDNIYERFNDYNKYVSVCNSFVDAILNYYYQKINRSGIKFDVTGKMPIVCNIVMFDLCTIISNLLDNALEAVENNEGEDKWIEMTFRYDDLMIYCNVVNPYCGELNIYKNKIMTKKNAKNHGYGLTNVKKSVELYNGSIEIKTENGLFVVLIALVNKEKMNI
jgi:Signal transduction histidine kinase regulating citrate/malate metabolism